MDKAKEIAETHWDFLSDWLRRMFVDGFVHGWKHGREDLIEEFKEKSLKDGVI